MAEFYMANHASQLEKTGTLIGWAGYSFQAATNITITHLITSIQRTNISEGTSRMQHVCIYKGQRVPTELLGDATIVISWLSGDSNERWFVDGEEVSRDRKQILPIEPVTLEAGEWYTIAHGCRSMYFQHIMGTVDYFDIPSMVAAESVLDDWVPTASVIAEQYYDWGITGSQVAIIDEEPDPINSTYDKGRPELGFIYGGFNIWVYKSGVWESVTDIWAYKSGAWQPVSSVDVNKDGWKPI